MIKRAMLALAVTLGLSLGIAAPAQADAQEVFYECPSGHSGVVTMVTSCDFADNVRANFYRQDGWLIDAYSPVTGQFYTMQCGPYLADMTDAIQIRATRCAGGNNAVVVFW